MAARSDNGRDVIARVEAQRTSTWIQIAALAGAGVCIAAAARLQSPINRQREALQLVMQSNIYRELPPEYAWVSAFGGAFRGILADIFWMRAEKLKEEGKYYEAHQLAKWICTLQPRFPQVWVFQAWNMSYNISVGTHTPQERWQWVYNGIRLLRDEGIPNNERFVPIYRELAWIWIHKVGDRMDDYHHYYKRMLAAMMETVLGAPPPAASNAQEIDWFRPVAKAPVTLDALIAERPGVKTLVERLDQLGVNVEEPTRNERVSHPLETQFFRPYTRFLNEKSLVALRTKTPKRTEEEVKLAEFFDAAADKEDFKALVAYLRSKVLREQYKMDPKYMLALTGDLGTDEPIPIDWRTPWGHAIYWAKYGVEKGRELKTVKEFDLVNTDRILLNALPNLAMTGRYSFRINLDDPFESFLATGPDLRYVDAMHKMYIRLGKRYADPGEKVENRTCEALRSGHVNNLESAIVSLYLVGNEEKAQEYLDYLAAHYENPNTGEMPQAQYIQPLRDFVRNRLPDIKDTYASAIRLIYVLLQRSYIALATGRDTEYRSRIREASELWQEYQKEMADTVQGRMKLHEFPYMRATALYYFLTNANSAVVAGGGDLYPLAVRSAVWHAEEPEVKQYCYDQVIGFLAAECEKEGFDVRRAFPEPPGMDAWRQAHPKPLQEEDEPTKAAAKPEA